MFFDSKAFRALEAGTQAALTQQQLHLQNISNYETPGYKTKSLSFGDELEKAKGQIPNSIRADVITDETTSIRQDGNNVDLEKEGLELYKTYAQYTMLLDRVKGQFNMYNYVLNSNMR